MTRQVYWLVMNMVLVVSFTIPLYLHMQNIIPGIALPFSNLENSAVTKDIWLLTITSSTLLAAGVSSFAIYMLIIEPILKVREGVKNIQRGLGTGGEGAEHYHDLLGRGKVFQYLSN